MIIFEFTKDKTDNLSEVLLGICVNSSSKKVNNDAKYLIAQDIKKHLPTMLMHTYSESELCDLIESVKNLDIMFIQCREIIPTDRSIGIIREVKFNLDDLETLTSKLFYRNRYYLICKYMKEGVEVCSFITYNPNITELTSSKIRMSSLDIHASTVQLGSVVDFERFMEIKKTIPEVGGKMVIYSSKEVD